MPLTVLDVIVIVVVLISAVLAMVRGFVREVLSVASWVAAAAAAYFLYKPVLPLVQPYIDSNTVATIVVGGGDLLRRADHRQLHHDEDLGLRDRQPGRGGRPRARLHLRRGARPAAPGRSRSCSSTGWCRSRRRPGSPRRRRRPVLDARRRQLMAAAARGPRGDHHAASIRGARSGDDAGQAPPGETPAGETAADDAGPDAGRPPADISGNERSRRHRPADPEQQTAASTSRNESRCGLEDRRR